MYRLRGRALAPRRFIENNLTESLNRQMTRQIGFNKFSEIELKIANKSPSYVVIILSERPARCNAARPPLAPRPDKEIQYARRFERVRSLAALYIIKCTPKRFVLCRTLTIICPSLWIKHTACQFYGTFIRERASIGGHVGWPPAHLGHHRRDLERPIAWLRAAVSRLDETVMDN